MTSFTFASSKSSAFILGMRCRSRGRLSVILVVIFGGIFLFENLIRIEKPFCDPVEFVVGINEALRLSYSNEYNNYRTDFLLIDNGVINLELLHE